MKYSKEEISKNIGGINEFFIGYNVFVRLGCFLSRFFLRTGLTPNQITWSWGAMMTISSLFLVLNE